MEGFEQGNQFQTLLGVTGSGKTFTTANVIEQLQKTTPIIAHNRTLAGQLCSEFKEFFPENAVEYFVSWYEDGFHVVHFVSKLRSFSMTFDTKNGKMDQVEQVINRGIVNRIRRGCEYWR